MCTIINENGVKISYDLVRQAMKNEPYPMTVVGEDIDSVMGAVNQGIDAHLEACFVPDRGDRYEHGDRRVKDMIITRTLKCKVSEESLPILIRRLFEAEDENSNNLASNILSSIDIEDDGKWEPEET